MIGELPDSKGYNAPLVVVDCLSKQIHAIPTVTSLDSTGVTQLFLEHIWCHHRLPEEVISSRGSAFVSNFLSEYAVKSRSHSNVISYRLNPHHFSNPNPTLDLPHVAASSISYHVRFLLPSRCLSTVSNVYIRLALRGSSPSAFESTWFSGHSKV